MTGYFFLKPEEELSNKDRVEERSFLDGKTIFLRVDTNTTLVDGRAHENQRIITAARTIRRLAVRNRAKVIVGTHNGRKGDVSYVGVGYILNNLKKSTKGEIRYIGNTFSDDRLNEDAIREACFMKPGEAIILENLRFLPNETSPLSPEEHAATGFISDLIEKCKVNFYMLDAFSVAHRSHRSVVGFGAIPCIAGPNLHQELHRIELIKKYFHDSGRPNSVYILGGVKIQDYFPLIESALRNNDVSKILTGGLLGNLCLFAQHRDIGEETRHLLQRPDLKGKTAWDYLEKAKGLMEEYPDIIEVPIDLTGRRNGTPITCGVDDAPKNFCAFDIGENTIRRYKKLIRDTANQADNGSTLVYIKGPVGAYDREEVYARGSRELLTYITGDLKESVYTVMGGGDTTSMLKAFKIDASLINYISLAGGALIKTLGGELLPGVEILKKSYERFGGDICVYTS